LLVYDLPTVVMGIPQVTKLKLEQKQKEGIAEARSGRRGPVSSLGLPFALTPGMGVGLHPVDQGTATSVNQEEQSQQRNRRRLPNSSTAALALHTAALPHVVAPVRFTPASHCAVGAWSHSHLGTCPCCAVQNSVWGSGSAGAACAVLALLTGDFALWQVGGALRRWAILHLPWCCSWLVFAWWTKAQLSNTKLYLLHMSVVQYVQLHSDADHAQG
jgi:hypothetical protein